MKYLFLLIVMFCIGAHAEDEKPSNASTQKVNLGVEPIFLIVGDIQISADFKIADNWTLGPTLRYWHPIVASGDTRFTDNISLTTYGVGVRGTWSPAGVFTDGWYLSPAGEFISSRATTTSAGQNISSSLALVAFTGVGGYNWFWNHFNVRLGAGLTLATAPTKIHIQSANSTYTQDISYDPATIGFQADFMVGRGF